jgi:hypothetical protein
MYLDYEGTSAIQASKIGGTIADGNYIAATMYPVYLCFQVDFPMICKGVQLT